MSATTKDTKSVILYRVVTSNFKITIPASTSNLGPGFDCFGLALNLYNEYELHIKQDSNSDFDFESNLDSDKIPQSKENLIYKSFTYLFEKGGLETPSLKVKLNAQIPTNGGFGSSSTAVVAGLFSANKILKDKYTKEELINFACQLDGHPDNVSAAILGNFVVSTLKGSKVIYKELNWDLELDLITVMPDLVVSTNEARKVLPKEVSLNDAIANLSYSSLFISAVLTKDLELLSKCFEDKLHQEQRLSLIKGSKQVLKAAKDAGAMASFISGSGSTLIALSQDRSKSKEIGQAMCASFKESSIESSFKIVNISKTGAIFN